MDHVSTSEANYYAIFSPQPNPEAVRVFTEISKAASESRKINARFKVSTRYMPDSKLVQDTCARYMALIVCGAADTV